MYQHDAEWADSISGTGPGVIAPDGSPVEFYALMPSGDKPAMIQKLVPEGGSILELGAGAGRLATPLANLGFDVVAVDESPEMLAKINKAKTICARIEQLRLDRRFDAVILPSYLVNWPDALLRGEFLRTCREHVRSDGTVLIEWQPGEWYDRLGPEITNEGAAPKTDPSAEPVAIRMTSLRRPSSDIIAATVEYRAGDQIWTQSFVSQRLADDELAAHLSHAGLKLEEFLTPDRNWVRAIPS